MSLNTKFATLQVTLACKYKS